MNEQLIFLTETPYAWIIAAACLLSFGSFLWLEFREARGARAWLRVGLLFLVHAALLLLALRPAVQESLPPKKAIVLQANASSAQHDSLRSLYPEAETYSLGQQETHLELTHIPHISYLQQQLSEGSTVFLLGSGLDKDELQYLQSYELNFLPAEIPPGLQGLSYIASLSLSDSLQLTAFGSAGADSLRLRLSLGGQALDSALLAGAEVQQLQLSALPPLAGQLEYRLDLLNQNSDTLEHYPLLVLVRDNPPVQLALLTGFPSFETRHLKNWLAREGHRVYYQAEMAPGRFNREWLNMEEIKPMALNQELLGAVDLLMIDQAYWNKLSPAIIKQLENAVKNDGLGLLLLGQSGLWKPAARSWESLPSLQLSARTQQAPLWREAAAEGTEISYFTAEAAGWWPQLRNAHDAPLMLLNQQGLGKVGVSLLENTYPLLLHEQDADYSRLWSRMLNSLLSRDKATQPIEAAFPAFVGKQQQLRFWQREDEMPEVVLTEPNGRRQLLPLIQDAQISTLWYTYYHPAAVGEHSLRMQGEDSISFMVYPVHQLGALQQFQQMRETHLFADRSESFRAAEERSAAQYYTCQQVSLFWFYGLFLLGMTGLWVERKLSAA